MHPRRADTDRDGIRDGREDTDGDGLRTSFEFLAGTSPRRADTDGDGLRDGRENPDRDALSNATEQRLGTNPRVADTDHDGWTDGAEYKAGTDPRNAVQPSAGDDGPPPPPPPTPGAAPTVPGAPACPIFPADNVWNFPIDGRAVAADSATMIGAIGLDRGLHMDFGSYAGYGIPYQVVTASTPRSTVTFEYDQDSDHVGYPIPASPLIEGGSDRHMLMVDKDACQLYELFARAAGRRRLDGGEWRNVGPALERIATGDLDQRRRGRPADPSRPRPLRRGRRRRYRPRAAVHHQPHPDELHLPGPPPGRRIGLDLAPADGPARPAQGRLRHEPALAAGARPSQRRSSATG